MDDVSVGFARGEIHAIIGENGAGKSTLMKVLSGAIQPDQGTITVEGHEYNGLTPRQSLDLGIQVIYQELNQIGNLSVMDNVFIGSPPHKGILVDFKTMEAETRRILDQLGMGAISPRDTVASLTPGYQQMVEIAKALTKKVKLLILDEPTSALSTGEADTLFEVVEKLSRKGVTILFISHRLEEIFRIASRVTVMRDGKMITTRKVSEIDRTELINLMVGRDFNEVFPVSHACPGETLLEVKHISGPRFHDVSLYVRRGEILGLAGLVGAGRTETMLGIFGAARITSGEVWIKGKQKIMKSPQDSIRHGVAFLPENRKTQGLILSLPVKNNIDLPSLKRLSRWFVIDKKADDRLVEKSIEELAIKTPSKDQVVVNLSGGNQQKVVVAKWMGMESDILIFDEPTKGIDVSSKQEIYNLLCQLAEKGKAVILVSSDMEEIMGVSDRIAVFYEGTVWGELKSRDEFDEKKIMQYASGIK
nr:sugar ABC transporter ATP-binding protein [Anaerofilum hominis]